MRVLLPVLALLLAAPAAAAGLPEAPVLPGTPAWPETPAAEALAGALRASHCGQAPPTARSRTLWRKAGPGVEPIPLCRCLRAAAVARDPERFLALGAEAARRGTPEWHVAVAQAVDALPEAALAACLERQRR